MAQAKKSGNGKKKAARKKVAKTATKPIHLNVPLQPALMRAVRVGCADLAMTQAELTTEALCEYLRRHSKAAAAILGA